MTNQHYGQQLDNAPVTNRSGGRFVGTTALRDRAVAKSWPLWAAEYI
jgi:hypothetical protein